MTRILISIFDRVFAIITILFMTLTTMVKATDPSFERLLLLWGIIVYLLGKYVIVGFKQKKGVVLTLDKLLSVALLGWVSVTTFSRTQKSDFGALLIVWFFIVYPVAKYILLRKSIVQNETQITKKT